MAGIGRTPFDCDQIIGYKTGMRIVLRLLVLLTLLWVEGVWAVDCASTNYDLNSQAEVDALGASNCTSIIGNLNIANSADISNLNALVNLTEVGGNLEISSNSNLANVDGLLNVTAVGGSLTISSNASMLNIDGLVSTVSVGGNLVIESNDDLINLDGLVNLTSVGGGLQILSNNSLTNLDGLSSLASVDGNTVSSAGYCIGTPTDVICDFGADGRSNPGGNLDSWAELTWGFENTPIPNGKIVAYPFTANGGASNVTGILHFSNNMPDLTSSDYTWKGWFSETPGGAVLNNNNSYCRKYSYNPNPTEMRWDQSSSPANFSCNLGVGERVLYFNMAIGCYAEILASIPEAEQDCTVGEPFPGVGGYPAYYITVYPR